jgi:DNA N-6-adenine-methyltransferase (Dam)
MTLGSHQQCIGKSQHHITARRIIDRLGPFDLDPAAAPDPRPWECARINWSTDGLLRAWPRELFIYLNPPFDRYQVSKWVRRLARHGNGIALLHARTETSWFEPVWERASGILFLADRLHFYRPDGTRQPANSGAPAVLAAFGHEALSRLQRCGIAGVLVTGWHIQLDSEVRSITQRGADLEEAQP